MEKRWTAAPKVDPEICEQLCKAINVDAPLATILINRGVTAFDEAKAFFRPNIEALHNPFLMKDMDVAVTLLSKALTQKNKILVYGDYDVDGTSAVALVYGYLKSCNANVEFYIPDRYKEGYGVSKIGIDYAISNKIDLLITLDCGIKAIDNLTYAKENGIQVIVCDHHLPGEILPPANAILNAKQSDCSYPFKELCGCGVGFKLLQGLVAKNDNLDAKKLHSFFDLVAIATAADIVPIVGENRVLTALGLQEINKNPRPGIVALTKAAQFQKNITVNELVFFIAPRINAAGRIDHGAEAVKLLAESNFEESEVLAKKLEALNAERRGLDKTIAEEALEQIEAKNLKKHNSTVVYQEDWHKGVVGIVASRLMESYYRPTVVLCKAEDKVTGSVRSVAGFDVHAALEECNDYLDQFGGHPMAAGLTMQEENIEGFREKFEQVVSSSIASDLLVQEIFYESELQLAELTQSFYSVLRQMAPFGPKNRQPRFLFSNVLDTGYAKIVGEKHIKMKLFQHDNRNLAIDAIAFGLADKLDIIKEKMPFQVIASIEENHWNGKVTLQLVVKDIKRIL